MSWSIDTRNLPGVSDYASASKVLAGAKPWRGMTGEHDERPVSKGDRHKKHFSVRLGNNEQIIFRLFNLDVVTYNKDGTIDLVPYSSRSTSEFVRGLTPGRIAPEYTRDLLVIRQKEWSECVTWSGLWDNAKYYRTLERTRLVKDGDQWTIDPSTPTQPWIIYHMDKGAAARALNRTRYPEFRTWLKAVMALDSGERPFTRGIARRDLMATLEDRSTWMTLINAPKYYTRGWRAQGAWLDAQRILADLRKAVYEATPGLISTETKPVLVGAKEYSAWRYSRTYS